MGGIGGVALVEGVPSPKKTATDVRGVARARDPPHIGGGFFGRGDTLNQCHPPYPPHNLSNFNLKQNRHLSHNMLVLERLFQRIGTQYPVNNA